MSLNGWIKIDTRLHEKPEVMDMASILNISPHLVIGYLVRIWSWFDQHTENGHALRVTLVTLDRLIGHDGFAEALNIVGWLNLDNEGCSIPNFDRHNGKSAKKRGLDAERKAKNRHELLVTHVTSNAGPEKRREEKRKSFSPTQIEGVIHRPSQKTEDVKKDVRQSKSERLGQQHVASILDKLNLGAKQ